MRGLLNLSVDRINSIDAFRIALLKEFSLFSFPNKRVLTILSSFSVKILESIVAILSKRVCLWRWKFGQWRRKCFVVSVPLPQLHIGSTESWKLCLNLCSFRWLNPILNLVRYLIPRGLWILKILFGKGLIKSRICFLKTWNESAFFTKQSNLFHSVIAEGKKEFLK